MGLSAGLRSLLSALRAVNTCGVRHSVSAAHSTFDTVYTSQTSKSTFIAANNPLARVAFVEANRSELMAGGESQLLHT